MNNVECTSLWRALETCLKHDAKLFPCRRAHTRNAWVQAGAALKHFSYANPLKKAWLEAAAALKHFPLEILWKAWLEAGASWKHFLLQILWEKLDYMLRPVWGIFSYKSFEKCSIIGWSWCRAFSFTNALRNDWLQAGTVPKPIHEDFSFPPQLFLCSLAKS